MAVIWQDVSGSLLTVGADKGWHECRLGVGSTLSASSFGRGGRGYRYYRLITTTQRRHTDRSTRSASG